MGFSSRQGRLLAVTAAGLTITAVTAAAGPAAFAAAVTTNGHGGHAKSVIFINGDGMSAAHREAARLSLAGLDGQLNMDKLPVSGQLSTSPHDPKAAVTDSAAAATAWATGVKTYNGAIGVDVKGRPLPVLGQQAKAAGKSTGLVTTSQVTDASPAAFFSHTTDRAKQDDIARQYITETKPDVILGGGEDWWLPAGTAGAYPDKPAEDASEESKGTKGNLIKKAQAAGYQYVSDSKGLSRARNGKLLGLFSNEEMFQQQSEGEGDVYSPAVDLATMTSKALDTLSTNKKGFFLMVEEEAIDEFAHHNNGTRVLQAMASLEKAVKVARGYVASHPDTLLVITGDHDCGGLTVKDAVTTDESGTEPSTEDGPFPVKGSNLKFVMDWSTTEHTGVDVPVTAEGPLADRFTGKHPNTHVHDVLAQILNSKH
ncbi:alkaline phosphatase [Streptosporangium sp. NBC_01756]|uniref:alkaline phosphatase n=1 Tax=Streptosporangium sp. NBC_01756 TaxID=2975950 RepID=UPI002DDB304A|nr:alkaline phosphatase [Streptosporangium sp. NBC_01756]WSC84673.1 alkaline phosphatase [Streptosporangium sp. NBC_01756]